MALSKKYDYRFDPFLETKSYNEISNEDKLVPANTPYYVRLEEVPEQASPSTITARDTTAGLTLSEVSTAPASGEFQVDYRYNTSYVRLNAAQAGHTIRFAYQGTGHCIKAEDFNAMQTIVETMPESFVTVFGGDGSDGDVTISSNTDISGTVKQYNSLTVNSGVTLTAKNTIIIVKETLTINGTILASGGGLASGGVGALGLSLTSDLQCISPCGGGGGGGDGDSGNGLAGGSSGGAGGAGGVYSDHTNGYDGSASSADTRKFALNSTDMIMIACKGASGGAGANGGGAGGAGGGVLLIECNELIFPASGILAADGTAGTAAPRGGSGAGGGGGGGFILVRAKTITTNAGTIHADGGAGGAANGTMISGAGGAGGAGYAVIVDV